MRNPKLVLVLKLDSHSKMPVQAHSAIHGQSSCTSHTAINRSVGDVEKDFWNSAGENLAAVLLIEAVFNCYKKQMYIQESDDEACQRTQFGSFQKRSTAKNQTGEDTILQQVLLFDVICQLRRLLLVDLVDVMQCYNRITHVSYTIKQSLVMDVLALIEGIRRPQARYLPGHGSA